jgi:hypothetical protein
MLDTETGELTEKGCNTHAWLQQLGVVLPATAASRTPLWLASGWECRGRRLSRA